MPSSLASTAGTLCSRARANASPVSVTGGPDEDTERACLARSLRVLACQEKVAHPTVQPASKNSSSFNLNATSSWDTPGPDPRLGNWGEGSWLTWGALPWNRHSPGLVSVHPWPPIPGTLKSPRSPPRHARDHWSATLQCDCFARAQVNPKISLNTLRDA